MRILLPDIGEVTESVLRLPQKDGTAALPKQERIREHLEMQGVSFFRNLKGLDASAMSKAYGKGNV